MSTVHSVSDDFWNDASTDGHGFETELSAMELASIAIGGVTVLNGAVVMAAAAPVYTSVMALAGGGLGWAGYRRRIGKSINPFASDDTIVEAKPAPAVVKPVVNTQGAEVEIETL